MKLAKKLPITYNGLCYFIDIVKDCRVYRIKIYNENIGLKRIFKKYSYISKCNTKAKEYDKYNGNIDNLIKDSFTYLNGDLKEQTYINNMQRKYIADNEYKNKLYNEFYERVVDDLKEKGIIDKNLFKSLEHNTKDTYDEDGYF